MRATKCHRNTSSPRTSNRRVEKSTTNVPVANGSPQPSLSLKPTARTWSIAENGTRAASPVRSVGSYYQIGGHLLSTSERAALANPELALFIPCRIDLNAKPERMVLIAAILPDGYEDTRYVCPDCGAIRIRHKSMSLHMGLVPNMPASCPIYKKRG